MSMLKDMALQEGAVRANYEVDLALNEYATLQESFNVLNGGFVYEAEMIPVFESIDENGDPMYCIEADMFDKLIDTKNITIPDGLDQLYNSISCDCKKGECECPDKSQLAIVVKSSDYSQLESTIKSDVTKINARYEAVVKFNDKIKQIMSEGVRILTV